MEPWLKRKSLLHELEVLGLHIVLQRWYSLKSRRDDWLFQTLPVFSDEKDETAEAISDCRDKFRRAVSNSNDGYVIDVTKSARLTIVLKKHGDIELEE